MTAPPLPPSLWAATARPAADTPPLEGEAAAEVAIVGGGFTGLSAALHAAEGGADTVLVESAEPGFGASGRNGGQVIPGLKLDPDAVVARFGAERGERFVRFAGRAPDLVFDLIERHAIACDAARAGWIQAAHAARAMPTLESRARQWQALGARPEILDRDRIASLTGTPSFAGGLLDPRGGTLNPLGYARGLAAAALAAGARIHGASPATAVTRAGRKWSVATPGGRVTAEQVVICTNGYTGGLWPGLKRAVVPLYSSQVATRPLSDNLRKAILPGGQGVADTRRLLTYFRLDPQGRLVVGGRGYNRESADPRDYAPVAAVLRRYFPQAADSELTFHWSGKVAMTRDQLPQLAELAPGVTAALGYNGRGVAMATAMGRVLGERILGRPLDALPVPLRPLTRYPLHGLRGPVIPAVARWKRLQDLWEAGR